jgi:hypothetical protein
MSSPGQSAVGARAAAVLLGCIGVALSLGVVGASAAGPAPSFAAAKKYAGKTWPTLVTVADMNGDGTLDLVTRNGPRGGGVSVFLNGGDGSFRERHDYVAPRDSDVAIGDLNGDGKPDVTVPNNGGATVSIRLNRGDGSLGPEQAYRTGIGPFSVATADLDGDGRPDLVTANSRGNTVSVLRNEGDGSFGQGSTIRPARIQGR